MTNELGERIKHARRIVKLEQSDLAKEVDVSVGTLSRWERGVSKPSKADLKAIAHYTGTSFLWLSEGLGPMTEAEISSSIQAIQDPDGSTTNLVEISPSDRFAHQVASLDSPARLVLEQMLDEGFRKIRQNQTFTDDDVARVIQTIREITER